MEKINDYKIILSNENLRSVCIIPGCEPYIPYIDSVIDYIIDINKIRKSPLEIVINGRGSKNAYIIARLRGYTFVEGKYDAQKEKFSIVNEENFSNDVNKKLIKCYGSEDYEECAQLMKYKHVAIVIFGKARINEYFNTAIIETYKMVTDNDHNVYYCHIHDFLDNINVNSSEEKIQ
jgi:hypothetical protein